jgi:serine/threonine-protein kinase RsbW
MSPESNSITVTCDKKNLRSIRDFVSNSLREFGIDENMNNMIVLAVDEVCANLIIHSNNCNTEETIQLDIKLERQPEGLLFEIFDRGRFFDYETYQEPSLAEIITKKKKGSIGLMLVRRIMDKIEFSHESTHNVCRLFKKIDNLAVA